MFNHIMVGSNDIERSKRFYTAVLGVLGAGEPMVNVAPSGHTRLFYRHAGGAFGACADHAANTRARHGGSNHGTGCPRSSANRESGC